MIREQIINAVRREAENIPKSGFPLEVFPEKVQSIVLDMVKYENYVLEFTATAMLSAAATALGNARRIRVKGTWTSNPALYFIFVGRAGLGKTHPIEAAYRPIRDNDTKRLAEYKAEMERFEKSLREKESEGRGEKPLLARTIISDFTPEALLYAHSLNPRGVVLLVDEIMGMFNSVNRYTNGQLIEQLLTAWSGTPLDVIRRSNDMPIHIEQPCINIIGTIQTPLVGELFSKGYKNNGLLDRILFVYPDKPQIAPWRQNEHSNGKEAYPFRQWQQILGRIITLDGKSPSVLGFTSKARTLFYDWQNSIIAKINSIDNDADVDTRDMKRCINSARLALVMQHLYWACDEGECNVIEPRSVSAAIALSDYFESCYSNLVAEISDEPIDNSRLKEFLGYFVGEFTTADALWVGSEIGAKERTVKRWLSHLTRDGVIDKIGHGKYKCDQI